MLVNARPFSVLPALVALLAGSMAGCGLTGGAGGENGGRVEVVAAENFWGNIAGELGGSHVNLTSIVANPATDPHAYEATPADARTVASARYFILNGAGYDPWAPRLVAANPVPGRTVLSVADLVGRREGDNPHLWYSPDYVYRFVDRVTADLKAIDPADAADFDTLHTRYRTQALRHYSDLVTTIRSRYSGVRVGATESIFVYMSQATGLQLITPPEFMKAVSEGTDPSATDRVITEQQVAQKQVRVLVFNAQNTTPDVNALVDRARGEGLPVVGVTETLAPAGATFQDWQSAQLNAVLRALGG